MTLKGVITCGLRFPNCTKLLVSGLMATIESVLKKIDPVHLVSLQKLNISVHDAEQDSSVDGSEPSHLLTIIDFIRSVSSTRLHTVRINFKRIHLAHLIQALASTRPIFDPDAALDLDADIVVCKAQRLFAITTKHLVLPMQFLDDLDLTSSKFLTKHFMVSHTTK